MNKVRYDLDYGRVTCTNMTKDGQTGINWRDKRPDESHSECRDRVQEMDKDLQKLFRYEGQIRLMWCLTEWGPSTLFPF
jgi:hypothetical protein